MGIKAHKNAVFAAEFSVGVIKEFLQQVETASAADPYKRGFEFSARELFGAMEEVLQRMKEPADTVDTNDPV